MKLLPVSFFVASAVMLAFAGCSAPESAVAIEPGPSVTDPVAPEPGPATAPAPITPVCLPLAPRTTPLEVAVLPDAGAAPFVSVLSRATRTVRVMVYEMGNGPIIDTLESKARAGVKVQIILDLGQRDVNEKYMARLAAAGAQVIWSDPAFPYMHAKVMIIDDAEAVISTGNYAAFRMNVERNFAIHDADAADVDALVRIFDADFARKTPDLTCTRLLVSPVNARQRLLDLIASAEIAIEVESMQLADRDIRDALAARQAAGVTVRVLLADPGWITANTEAASFLKDHAILARFMKAPAVHVKAMLVDRKTAYAGSENLSFTSLSRNREIGLLITEPRNLSSMQTTFEKDWSTATPL